MLPLKVVEAVVSESLLSGIYFVLRGLSEMFLEVLLFILMFIRLLCF